MEKETSQKKTETALREEEVLAFWNNENIFEKSLKKDAPNGEFVFYDGPPFATGLPHIGHLLISSYKDTIGRYKTMQGYTVPRRWGWDCHGLPVENIVEKKLNLKTKEDIEALGIARFNEEAHNSVLTFVDDWKKYVERIGRWVDFDNSYKTMDNSYIESVWWALKKIHNDNRLYEGKKVLMYCPRCETPLSKAEIAMDDSYKDVTETAVYVKFKVKPKSPRGTGENAKKYGENVYILAWTTTPWTLPGNVALAVGPDITYCEIRNKDTKEHYILAKERIEKVFGDEWEKEYEIVEGSTFAGSHFARLQLKYEPLYKVQKAVDAKSEKAWTVQTADFVTTEEGTGVVHTAPMYGEDDYQFGLLHALPIVPMLDSTGTYNADAPKDLQGMYYKKGGKCVIEDLEKRGLLFAKHAHVHSYPHCYRCGTALIYNALTSWFINIQSVKKRLLETNEEVNWYPSHLKHGRFENIVNTAPDWTISRNRFWASPLPIWKIAETGEVMVFGSLKELQERTKKSGNKYIFIRHGEADSNVEHVISSLPENKHHITSKGKDQIEKALTKLMGLGITKIITSPLLRTKESADILAESLGLDEKSIVVEDRFKEWQLGDLNGKSVTELQKVCPTYENRFEKGCGTGETLKDMKRRVGEALYELEETYQNETILIVAHEYTVWFAECVAQGAAGKECVAIRGNEEDFIRNAEFRQIDFVSLSHNKDYELDLHRPCIDDLKLETKDKKPLVRIPEVVDCWVESGLMPYASENYPHSNKELVEGRFPGDYIAEYIAQTRTWFYYMHAMGVLLFDSQSFKNCVSTGTILASDGSKMSKSKGNFTNPLENINQYGADALRFYVLGSVVMNAEDVAFKNEELRDVHNRFINMLWNSYKFYEMHADDEILMYTKESKNILDAWILAKCTKLVREVTEYMDSYDTVRSARAEKEFVADFSQWYIRRSRSRFKSDDTDDRLSALKTTRSVLITLAKLIAPLTPYIAESVYKGAKGEKESVHLDSWPTVGGEVNENLIEDMAEVRRIASLALELRQKAGIKVRQPLAKLTLSHEKMKSKTDLIKVLLDEINVKEFYSDKKQKDEVLLDTTLTEELKQEGNIRDIVRAVQEMRKKNGLMPEDDVTLIVETNKEGEKMFAVAEDELLRVAGVKKISFESPKEGTELKIDTTKIVFELSKN